MKSDLGRSLNLTFTLIVATILMLNCALLHAAESIGRFSIVEGSVDLMRGGALPAMPVKTGDQVQTGDFIRTKSNARAEVTFNDGNVLKIAQRSRVDVAEYRSAGSGDSRKFNLPRGKVQAVVTKGGTGENKANRFEIRTPNAVAGVRGTDFFVFHDRNVTGVLVKEGSVYAFNPKMPQNVVTVPAGTITTVSEKGAPQPPRLATEAEKRGAEKETSVKPKGDSKVDSQTGGADPSPTDGPNLPTTPPDPPKPLEPPKPEPPKPEPPPPITDLNPENFAPVLPLGVADIKTNPMHRLGTIDPSSNLLTIVNQGPMSGLLGPFTEIWNATTAKYTIKGTYAGPGTQNNYWEGKIGSHNYATGGIDSLDGASFIGFIGGSNLDTAGTTSGNLSAIYVAPRGGGTFGAGLIYGVFSGALGNGIWDASGTMNRFELNSAVPSSLSATLATDPAWWATNTVFVNPSPVTGPTIGNQKNYNNAEGFQLDSSFNISSRLSDRGDVLKLVLFKPDPTFGVWQRESFGRYTGSNSDLVLVTDASVTQNIGGKNVPDHLFNVVSIGGWGANGAISGKAYGAWGDWEAGSARLLSGVVSGSYEAGLGTFGAVTNGAWLDVYRFLSLTAAERQQAGFPGIQENTITLSGSNALGSSVSLTNIRTFAHAAGDKLSLWATDSVSGTFSGPVPEGEQIAIADGGTQIRGSFRLERGGTSATSGNQVLLAEINGLGETTGPFRSSFNGIAAGTWSGNSFSGTAAGITHPITYYSSFGSTNLLRRYNGGAVYQYDGALHGVFGGMSLWGATSLVPSEFEIAGLHTPAAFANQDYVFSTNIDSFDVPSGTSKTADGGAYKGYLVGALARGTMYPEEPVDGRIAALYAAPDGSAGILAGKFNGYLDFNGVWESHGDWYPVALGTASPASWSLQTANLPLNAAQNGSFLGAGGGAIATVASITGNSFDRSWISGSPEWGVWNLSTSGTYSGTTYNQWFHKISVNDGSFFVNAEFNGNRWETLAPPPPSTVATVGKLKGNVGGNWMDLAPATPQTGILIGETVGTFDPIASRWQAVAVGAFMETNTFLQLAATTAGQAKLQQLNIPAFEIGSADFSGSGAVSGGNINVTLAGVKFFAPTAGGRPSLWATGSVSGNFTGTPATGNTVTLSGSSATVSGLAPTLTIDSWSGSKWRASIMDNAGTGSVGGHSNVNMFGKGAGSYSAGSLSGTAVGTAK